jgi:hypothetical protein
MTPFLRHTELKRLGPKTLFELVQKLQSLLPSLFLSNSQYLQLQRTYSWTNEDFWILFRLYTTASWHQNLQICQIHRSSSFLVYSWLHLYLPSAPRWVHYSPLFLYLQQASSLATSARHYPIMERTIEASASINNP